MRIEWREGVFLLRTEKGDSRVNPLGLRFAGTYEDSYEKGILEMVAKGGWKRFPAGEMAIVELGRVRGLGLDRIEAVIQKQYRRAYYSGWLKCIGSRKGQDQSVAS